MHLFVLGQHQMIVEIFLKILLGFGFIFSIIFISVIIESLFYKG